MIKLICVSMFFIFFSNYAISQDLLSESIMLDKSKELAKKHGVYDSIKWEEYKYDPNINENDLNEFFRFHKMAFEIKEERKKHEEKAKKLVNQLEVILNNKSLTSESKLSLSEEKINEIEQFEKAFIEKYNARNWALHKEYEQLGKKIESRSKK